jgi:hypothetical protein
MLVVTRIGLLVDMDQRVAGPAAAWQLSGTLDSTAYYDVLPGFFIGPTKQKCKQNHDTYWVWL